MAVKTEYRKQLFSVIRSCLPGSQIYLFGSRATDSERAGSDIDLAIDNGSPIPYRILVNLLVQLDETTVPMKIDLVDLQAVSGPMKESILREGILWTN